MATVTTTTDPKPGVKSTEFWAAIGIGGLPLLEGTGWFKNWPITEGGEIAMWSIAGAVMCSYIWSRAWVKVQGKGEENANSSINRATSAIRTSK
tara:strand:+ start:204 stop:485 length:282 start_codon:yes stop_codon:yes gene_type:complete